MRETNGGMKGCGETTHNAISGFLPGWMIATVRRKSDCLDRLIPRRKIVEQV